MVCFYTAKFFHDFFMYYSFKYRYRNKIYSFVPWCGILRSVNNQTTHDSTLAQIRLKNPKINSGIELIEDPYKVHTYTSNRNKPGINRFPVRAYAKLLVWLYHHFYWGLYLMSKFHFDIFEDAIAATDEFCRIVGNENQHLLCLPRSIFAATTSKKFKSKGIMIIGVFFPAHFMHAWIMEDGFNNWRDDNIWTNYTPVAIMT